MTQSDAASSELRPPYLHRVTRRQLQVVDFLIAGVLVLLAVAHLSGGPRPGARSALSVVLIVAAGSIAIRRRAPGPSLGLMTVALAMALGSTSGIVPSVLIAFPMYQMAATRPRRKSLTMLGSELAALAVFFLIGAIVAHGATSVGILAAVASWFVGDSVRVRRVYVAGLAEQAAQRQREILERAQRSVAEERLQMARELHDVVAHTLSVIAVQSGVGRHVIDTRPAEAKASLAAIEATSRSALDELRRMLGALRDRHDPAELAPAPGVAMLPALVGQLQAAGVAVELSIEGTTARSLSSSAELSVYRIVQEALTNVVKHATGARAEVSLRDEDGRFVVEVRDDGGGVGPALAESLGTLAGGRHGIIGMRERAGLFGGTLRVGPDSAGGFLVVASFPRAQVLAA